MAFYTAAALLICLHVGALTDVRRARPRWLVRVVLSNEINQVLIDLLRMREAQEVLAVLDCLEACVGRVDEELDLLFCVGDGVDDVARALRRN